MSFKCHIRVFSPEKKLDFIFNQNFASNHSIMFSDPGNESQGSGGSKTPSESRIAQLVAEILHDTFRWMLSKRWSAWAFCSPGDKKDITFLYINKCIFYIECAFIDDHIYLQNVCFLLSPADFGFPVHYFDDFILLNRSAANFYLISKKISTKNFENEESQRHVSKNFRLFSKIKIFENI